MAEENVTTKIGIDISELKKNITEANRRIRSLNAEFKSATAGMDSWSDSTDGLAKKVEQMTGIVEQEKIKLSALEEQYKQIAETQGKDSKAAEDLYIKMKNQEAAVGRASASLKKYTEKLNETTEKEQKSKGAFASLEEEISNQEKELDRLKDGYKDAALEFGETSKEANAFREDIKKLSGELADNKSKAEQLRTSTNNLDESFEKTKQAAEKSEDGFSSVKVAIGNLISEGIKKMTQEAVDALKRITEETQTASNSFQAITGETDAVTQKFSDKMKEMYKDGYGESLKDIGDKMAYVKQVTKETDPSKVKELTENAIALEDTFGSDFQETIRGVNGLMTHFGTDSTKAFDLFAKGSQKGLDYTNELGDNVAEYGGNFKQAGYTVEEYFQLLANGTKNGAYNLDKVNDSINEVKNKLGDGSIEKNIGIFSKDTKKSFKAWKDGKGTMKKVIDSIVKDINGCKNEQKALTMASTAFGTMGEDANLKVVKSLKSTGKTFKKVQGSAEKLKEVKYDDVATKFKNIGRTVQLDLFVPLAEKLLPKIEQLADYAIKHIDGTERAIVILGGTMGVIFATAKFVKLFQTLQTIYKAFVTLKTAIASTAAAQKILNLIQAASPMGLLAAGIGAVVGGLALYAAATKGATKVTDKESESIDKMIEKHDKTKKSVDEMTKSWKDLKKTRDESVSGTTEQFDYYKKLKDELDDMVDKNGKVKKSQKDRAKFIVTTLNDALGTELKMTGRVIKNYEKEKKSIDKLIEAKKAQAILNANEDSYATAIKGQKGAFQNLEKAQANFEETTSKLEAAQKKLKGAQSNKKLKEYVDKYGQAGMSKWGQELNAAKEAVSKLTNEQKKNQKTVNDAEKQWTEYNATIENYEGLSSAIISGDAKKINTALNKTVNNFISAKTGTKKQLEDQVENMKKNYEDLKTAVANGTPGVTKKMVGAAKQMVTKSEKELEKYEKKTKKSGQKATDEYKEGLELGKNKAGKKASEIGKLVTKKLKETKTKEAGENFVQGLKDGMEKGKQSSGLITTVTKIAGDALTALKKKLDIHSPSKETAKIGRFFTSGLAEGIEKAYETVGKAVSKLAKKSLSQLKAANKTGKYSDIGTKVSEAYANGITKQEQKAEKAVKKLVDRAVKKAQKETKNKKSKESFKKLGENLAESFSTAFSKAAEKAAEKVQKKIESMTSSVQEKYDAVKDLQDDLQSRLSSGDLFTKDDDGKITLTDFKSETAKIIQYGKNMEALKKTLSSELMTEIAALDTSDGLDLTTKLLSLNGQELAAYNKAYTDKINASKKVANTYYAERVKQIKDNYTKQVKTVMAGLEKQLENIGENAMKGFVKGFNSKSAELNKSAKQLKKTLVSSIKKELGIHSPSKVMDREAGVFIIPGLTKGIERKLPALRQMMQRVRENVVNPMKNAATTANLDVAARGARSIEKAAAATANTYNFYQTNNSPKALSRWDIYRQSRNLLGGVSNV
jgi:phage-related minor tail protein